MATLNLVEHDMNVVGEFKPKRAAAVSRGFLLQQRGFLVSLFADIKACSVNKACLLLLDYQHEVL